MGEASALEPVPNTPPVTKGFASAIMLKVIIAIVVSILIITVITVIITITVNIVITVISDISVISVTSVISVIIINTLKEVLINYVQAICKYTANARRTQVGRISLKTATMQSITINTNTLVNDLKTQTFLCCSHP